MKQKIIFRADASSEIGYGHFIRTLALADMLKDNFLCTFATQSPSEYQKNEVAKVCQLVQLPSDDSKFQIFLDTLVGDEIVVLDNYFFTTEYQKAIKNKGCKLVCIDDMHDKHYVADIVINHGCYNPNLFSKEPYTKLCLGLEWALLRKPFLYAKPLEERENGHFVVAFGGSDYYNLTCKFAKILQHKEDVTKVTAIIGDAYQFTNELQQYTKVEIVKNLSAENVAKLFCQVEAAILPSSTIAIEAIACQCKVFAGWYVENQREFYNNLLLSGKIIELDNLVFCNALNINLQISKQKIETATTIKKYIDFFSNLKNISASYLRFATQNDVDMLYKWANEPSTRTNSLNSQHIPYTSHQQWFKNLLEDNNKTILIMLVNNTEVGQVRIVQENYEATISYSIAEKNRGRGYGYNIINLAEIFICENKKEIKRLNAIVKKENVASCKIFEKSNFVRHNAEQEDIYIYTKDIN